MANKKFSYIAKNEDGKTMRGAVEAGDKRHAVDMLRIKGLFILKLEEVREGPPFLKAVLSLFQKKVPPEELVLFARQMVTLVEAGITIVSALDILSEQTENEKFRSVLSEVRSSVNTGSSLSEAMGRHSDVFNPLFVNMVRAGESSGTLDVVLDRLASYMEKTNALQRKIKSALIYPAVVISMAIIITIVMILKVVPVFKDVFSGFNAALPAPTQMLIDFSDFLKQYFLLVVVMAVLALIGGRMYAATYKGRIQIDRLKLKLPVFGQLLRKVAISRFTRTLSTLVKSGVPILTSLEIVSKTAGNVIVELSVSDIKNSVRDGESIAQPMEKSGIFPPLVTRMVSVGERSGELEKMLSKISDFFDEQVDTDVEGLTGLLEPLIIVFLGVVIGGIVLCMFLPIFKLPTIISF
ncbi:MAG: type II secretion system F family protein [Candidatus Omnitrophica bacterium]|nr:type II secretion system F family protein [Candidatus Omnitrophota bacterium]